MGRSTMTMSILGAEPQRVAKEIAERLERRFGGDRPRRLDVLFNPENLAEVQINGAWSDLDTAREAVASLDEVVGELGDVKVEVVQNRVFTARPSEA